MGDTTDRSMSLVQRAQRIAEEVAGPAADDVDRKARFPVEAVDAMRAAHMLGALVPTDLGGEAAPITDVADAVAALGRHCASTAMIFAMHHMQAACLVRHGRSSLLRDFQHEVAEQDLLLASATTEGGIGGDLRSSVCAVEQADGRFRLEKDAPVISYGRYADAVLATCRRGPDSPPSDQVLVVCRPPGLELEQTGEWDTLGFRGTCSPGFKLAAEGDEASILDDPFDEILSQTMHPVSHVLWGSVWLGLATAAVDRARRYVQAEARKKPGVTPPAALRLAELMTKHQQMESTVQGAANRYARLYDDADALSSISFAVSMNTLKVSASRLVVDIVGSAMLICGMSGYREDSPYSLGRLLRDAYGAALMVNNDRILANNAQLLLVQRES